ncbi:uncharacterized protein LOC135121331 [Zophobas morio]|uniref:uncharacterized protein LOC135121331 n=1 Tax=Zophobas morio TaxID=2755281 RepID=UPI0030827B8C
MSKAVLSSRNEGSEERKALVELRASVVTESPTGLKSVRAEVKFNCLQCTLIPEFVEKLRGITADVKARLITQAKERDQRLSLSKNEDKKPPTANTKNPHNGRLGAPALKLLVTFAVEKLAVACVQPSTPVFSWVEPGSLFASAVIGQLNVSVQYQKDFLQLRGNLTSIRVEDHTRDPDSLYSAVCLSSPKSEVFHFEIVRYLSNADSRIFSVDTRFVLGELTINFFMRFVMLCRWYVSLFCTHENFVRSVAGAANSAAEVLTQSATYVNIHVTAECPHISLPRRQNSASHFMLDLGTLNISNKFIKDAEDNEIDEIIIALKEMSASFCDGAGKKRGKTLLDKTRPL